MITKFSYVGISDFKDYLIGLGIAQAYSCPCSSEIEFPEVSINIDSIAGGVHANKSGLSSDTKVDM